MDRYAGDEFLEEKALLRNLVMQLDGLELLLRKIANLLIPVQTFFWRSSPGVWFQSFGTHQAHGS